MWGKKGSGSGGSWMEESFLIESKDLEVVIPRRRRVESCSHTVKLFTHPIVCVAEEEKEAYGDVGAEVVTHPNEVTGLGRLRQWILDHFKARVIFQCNDDVRSLYCVVGFGRERSWIRKPSSG